MKKIYRIEEAPIDLTDRQKIRWLAFHNNSPAFLMWKLRMKRANKIFIEMDYIKHGYDL